MKVVVAIDSLKGCLSSADAAAAIARGVRSACPEAEVLCLPVSDGGEGFVTAMLAALGGRRVTVRVRDPLGRPIMAEYGLNGDTETGVIEVAQACGLSLLAADERDPMRAGSHGVGELMADALGRGCSNLIVGLGGTATVDGGMGMLEALGTSRDKHTGRSLTVIGATDVTAPLCGAKGAARIFGPQKGATPDMVEQLEARLQQWARHTASVLGVDHSAEAGTGAAGGLGFALVAYLNATLRSGAELVLDAHGFDSHLVGAGLVITGEGSADRQTLMGKLPMAVLRRARRQGVPTALLAGKVSDRQQLLRAGFATVTCINPPETAPEACLEPAVARRHLALAAARLMQAQCIG